MITLAKQAKRALVLACLVTLAAYAQGPQSQPTGPTRVGQQDSLSVDVPISGVTDLFAYQFALIFNPAILSATLVEEGTFLKGFGPTSFVAGTSDSKAGIIDNIAGTLVGSIGGASGNGFLVAVTFLANAVGVSPLQLSDVILLDSSLSEIPVTVQAGSVTVEPIPEAGTAGMLTLGVLATIGMRMCRHGHNG
jgi:hypothetical protein